MALGSQAEYAVHRGCSEAYISRLKREGKLVIVETADGPRVDFEKTDELLASPARQRGPDRLDSFGRIPALLAEILDELRALRADRRSE